VSQVNLLPPEILRGQKVKRVALLIFAAGGVALALILAFYLVQVQRLSGVNDDIEAQQQTNQQIQGEIGELQRFEDLEVEAQRKTQLLLTAFQGEAAFSALLMDLSRITPDDSFLNSASFVITPDAADAGFVGSVSLSGEAVGFDTVTAWLTRLEQIEGWVNPWTSTISLANETIGSYSFSTTTDLTDAVLTDRGRGISDAG